MKTIEDLKNIGFVKIGNWFRTSKKDIDFTILDDNRKEILYSFVLNSDDKCEIIYIGKTIKTITERLKGYRKPGRTQNTNIRLNNAVSQLLLKENDLVEIFVLKNDDIFDFKGYKLNLAAGLEDILIKSFSPINNLHGNSKIVDEPETDEKHILLSEKKIISEELSYTGTKLASIANLSGKINLSFIPQAFLPEFGDIITIHLGNIEFNANYINGNNNGVFDPRVNSVLIGRWLVENNIGLGEKFYVKVCNKDNFYFYPNV